MADLCFSYLYFSMFAPPLINLDDEGCMFHRSVCIQLSDLDALDGRLFRTLEIIILMICFMSCTSFCVITYFSEN